PPAAPPPARRAARGNARGRSSPPPRSSGRRRGSRAHRGSRRHFHHRSQTGALLLHAAPPLEDPDGPQRIGKVAGTLLMLRERAAQERLIDEARDLRRRREHLLAEPV